MDTLNNADITNLKEEAELGPLYDMAFQTARNEEAGNDMRMRRAKADAEEHEIEIIGEEEEENERVIRQVYDTKHFLVEEGGQNVDVGDGERLTHLEIDQLLRGQRLRAAIPCYWDDLPGL